MRKLWALSLAFAAFGGSSASAITTYKDWNGSEYISPFGCPFTTTYGQVITIPKTKHTINSFSFWWDRGVTRYRSMVVRGEIYQWDGVKAAGGPLYESAPRKIRGRNTAFPHRERFDAAVGVTPGAQYVLFASIDKDYEKCRNSYVLTWGFIKTSTYSGGMFVYQNNGGNEGKWTTSPWSQSQGDLAFKVFLTP